jgi:hypothetical protein
VALLAVGNKETVADVSSKQAIVAVLQGDVPGAESRFRKGLRLFQTYGEKSGALKSLVGLAATAAEQADPVRGPGSCRPSMPSNRTSTPRLRILSRSRGSASQRLSPNSTARMLPPCARRAHT